MVLQSPDADEIPAEAVLHARDLASSVGAWACAEVLTSYINDHRLEGEGEGAALPVLKAAS